MQQLRCSRSILTYAHVYIGPQQPATAHAQGRLAVSTNPSAVPLVCPAGDAHGRRMTLMISILLITLPTLLMGCLPTYAHVGLAAPVLMAVLRFVQGIAVGGEVRGDCTRSAPGVAVALQSVLAFIVREEAERNALRPAVDRAHSSNVYCDGKLQGCSMCHLSATERVGTAEHTGTSVPEGVPVCTASAPPDTHMAAVHAPTLLAAAAAAATPSAAAHLLWSFAACFLCCSLAVPSRTCLRWVRRATRG